MRILIYEYITGGGLVGRPAGELESLRPEGEAMVKALAGQFAALGDAEVHVLRDVRLPPLALPVTVHRVSRGNEEATMLATLAASADRTILIGPELDGILLDRAWLVDGVGGRLLSPSPQVIALASDKRRTTRRLRRAGVPAPRGAAVAHGPDGRAELPHAFAYPAVLKRRDGAGSLGMRRVEHADEPIELAPGDWILEELVSGVAVSAAVLCGPNGHVVLPPFEQRLDLESFAYLGGSRLLDAELIARATHLAAKAAAILPEPIGYIGVDLVLGDDHSGSQDAVIEINPRLTTSFVGLAAIARTNLAAAMLAAAEGTPRAPEFTNDHVSFAPDGAVWMS